MKTAPYKLLIHTNSYTGNFDRELVAYVVGILDEYQKSHSNSYKKAFWNSVAASDIDSLEEYTSAENDPEGASAFIRQLNNIEERLNSILNNEQLADLEDKKAKREQEEYNNSILRLYDTYLCYTYQRVDDWEQDTFYNICSFYKNEEYNCDTIYIQLNKPLSEKLEKIVIERIKGFFENDVYNIIENYEWICQFGQPKQGKENYKLLDLELVDKDNNLIKKYQ